MRTIEEYFYVLTVEGTNKRPQMYLANYENGGHSTLVENILLAERCSKSGYKFLIERISEEKSLVAIELMNKYPSYFQKAPGEILKVQKVKCIYEIQDVE